MRLRWSYIKRLLAGAIFGLYMAHLLYFLNPQVTITPGRLATVTIVYGVSCGLLFGTVLWALYLLRVKLFGRPGAEGEFRAHGFGFVTLAAFVAAGIYWTHLVTVRDYLPIGAVRILSKATNLITATAFLLLILWLFERGADLRRSRIIFAIGAAVIALSSFFLYERRESYRTNEKEVVVANIGHVAGERPIVLVVVRNIPHDWIVTMIAEGRLPWFERAEKDGYFARVEPFPSTSPKALWASLATGKLPYRHGVTGRYSYRTPLNGADPDERFLLVPSGVGFRAWGLIPPVKRIAAQLPSGDALPLWRLFERLTLRTAVIGWPAVTDGAARVVVMERALRHEARPAVGAGEGKNGAGAAPERTRADLRADLEALQQATLLAGTSEMTAAWLEGFARAQLAIHVYSNELDPPQTLKGATMRSYVQELDAALAEVARAHPDHLLVVCSPSGVTPPDIAANAVALVRRAIDPGDPGADDGFILVAGQGVAHPLRPRPALVTDVVPTVLFAAGLPIGRDMDGRVLSEAFDETFLRDRLLTAIQTYEAERLVVRRSAVD